MTGLPPPLQFLKNLFLSLSYSWFPTADMALEELEKTPELPSGSKYANKFKSWRIGTDFYHLLIQIQIDIINLKTGCLKW